MTPARGAAVVDRVVALAAVDHVGIGAGHEPIVADAAGQKSLPAPPLDAVVAGAADQIVGTGVAVEVSSPSSP